MRRPLALLTICSIVGCMSSPVLASSPLAMVRVTPDFAGIVSPRHPWHQTFWVTSEYRMRLRPQLDITVHGQLRKVSVPRVQLPEAQWVGSRPVPFTIRGEDRSRSPKTYTIVWTPTASSNSVQIEPTALLLLGRQRGTVDVVAQVQAPRWIWNTTEAVRLTVRNRGTTWTNPRITVIDQSTRHSLTLPTVMGGAMLHETLRIPIAPWQRSTISVDVHPHDQTTWHTTAMPLLPFMVLGIGGALTTGLAILERRRRGRSSSTRSTPPATL
jgi:hypothetical protein